MGVQEESTKTALYHHVQLLGSFFNPLRVVAVDHKYQTLRTHTHTHMLRPACVCEVVAQQLSYLRADVIMSPQRPDDSLTPDVPNGEADVLILHRLHIKTCRCEGRLSPPAIISVT